MLGCVPSLVALGTRALSQGVVSHRPFLRSSGRTVMHAGHIWTAIPHQLPRTSTSRILAIANALVHEWPPHPLPLSHPTAPSITPAPEPEQPLSFVSFREQHVETFSQYAKKMSRHLEDDAPDRDLVLKKAYEVYSEARYASYLNDFMGINPALMF